MLYCKFRTVLAHCYIGFIAYSLFILAFLALSDKARLSMFYFHC